MKRILLQLADKSFIVSPETASRVVKALPPNRYVTTALLKDDSDDDDDDDDDTEDDDDNGNNKPKRQSGVFSKHQPKLTDKQKEQAARIGKHLSKAAQRR
jgi:hypothetical protein